MRARYPNQVCHDCDRRATTLEGREPFHASHRLLDPSRPSTYYESIGGERVLVINLDTGDEGENPVFIDGIQCWRRYRFGGWVTMADPADCTTLAEFMDRHHASSRCSSWRCPSSRSCRSPCRRAPS